jgi:hypothetical protein
VIEENERLNLVSSFLAGIIAFVSVALPIFHAVFISLIARGSREFIFDMIRKLSLLFPILMFGFISITLISISLVFGLYTEFPLPFYSGFVFITLVALSMRIIIDSINWQHPLKFWKMIIDYVGYGCYPKWLSERTVQQSWSSYKFSNEVNDYISIWPMPFNHGDNLIDIMKPKIILRDINVPILEFLAKGVKKENERLGLEPPQDRVANPYGNKLLVYAYIGYPDYQLKFPSTYKISAVDKTLAYLAVRMGKWQVVSDAVEIGELLSEMSSDVKKSLDRNDEDIAHEIFMKMTNFIIEIINISDTPMGNLSLVRGDIFNLNLIQIWGRNLYQLAKYCCTKEPAQYDMLEYMFNKPRYILRHLKAEVSINVRRELIGHLKFLGQILSRYRPSI